MIAEIVSIGTELLMGQIVNTDAQYLSRRLNALGISVFYHTTVGDNPGRMEQTLRLALSRSDVVITTGGLGPTGDDLSKEIVARMLHLPMERDEESMRRIEGYFSAMHRDMTHNNERQAMFARGAIILPNDRGTAPGCIVEQDGKAVIQLPGPPYELTDMFEKRVLPYLARRTGGAIASRYIRIFGVGESDAETRVKDLIDAQTDVTIAPYCSLGEVQLRVSARAGSEEEALSRIRPTVEAIAARLGDAVYAVSADPADSMEHYAVDALARAGRTVAVAESCTGGLVAARLVAIPGASAVLHEAHVVYANEAKERYLGVRPETLEAFGAVSEACAREMAEGLRARSGADVAVSTTGVAGPGGGTPQKPVGLVYVAAACPEGTFVRELRLNGDRQRVRTLASLHALNMIRLAALGALR